MSSVAGEISEGLEALRTAGLETGAPATHGRGEVRAEAESRGLLR